MGVEKQRVVSVEEVARLQAMFGERFAFGGFQQRAMGVDCCA